MDLRELGRHWETFARHDPLWAILNAPGRSRGRWDPDAFLATGEREVAELLDRARALGVAPAMGDALDFGCGAGRLTQALAGRFERAHGVDIAPSMIAEARRLNRRGPRCTFAVNATERLALPDASFDLACTSIVLQHMERRLMEGYLAELLRVLRPGGLLVCQVPSALRRPLEQLCDPRKDRIKRWLVALGLSGLLFRLRLLSSAAVMEMHCFERPALEAFLAARGAVVVAADPAHTAEVENYVYYVRRP